MRFPNTLRSGSICTWLERLVLVRLIVKKVLSLFRSNITDIWQHSTPGEQNCQRTPSVISRDYLFPSCPFQNDDSHLETSVRLCTQNLANGISAPSWAMKLGELCSCAEAGQGAGIATVCLRFNYLLFKWIIYWDVWAPCCRYDEKWSFLEALFTVIQSLSLIRPKITWTKEGMDYTAWAPVIKNLFDVIQVCVSEVSDEVFENLCEVVLEFHHNAS